MKRKESIFDAGRTFAGLRSKRTLAELDIQHQHWAEEERLIERGLLEIEEECEKRMKLDEAAGQGSQLSAACDTNEKTIGEEKSGRILLSPIELRDMAWWLARCLRSARKHAAHMKRRASQVRMKERSNK
jgi:hypothetical protein